MKYTLTSISIAQRETRIAEKSSRLSSRE